jgi:hypothetical protein
VALWEALPASAFHHGAFEFRDDGKASRSLFDAIAEMTGLVPMVDELGLGSLPTLGQHRSTRPARS